MRWGTMLCLAALGCQDLARLETEQAALEAEVKVLRENVETLRGRMKQAGLVKAGPANLASTTGNPDPETELSGELEVRVSRSGTALEIPTPDVERREKTPCGFRLDLGWLEPMSDVTLAKTGSGKASPLRLSAAGQDLSPHAKPPQFEKTCAGAFRHQGRYVFFSPPGDVDAATEIQVSLASEAPVPREDGRGMHWVYPGTTTTFSIDGGWDASWGPFAVDLDARLVEIGTPSDPKPSARGAAEVTVLGETASADTSRLGIHAEPAAPGGPWTIEVSSPADGPFVLIETLTVGNEEHALVIEAVRGKP